MRSEHGTESELRVELNRRHDCGQPCRPHCSRVEKMKLNCERMKKPNDRLFALLLAQSFMVFYVYGLRCRFFFFIINLSVERRSNKKLFSKWLYIELYPFLLLLHRRINALHCNRTYNYGRGQAITSPSLLPKYAGHPPCT